jgi:lipopolysaccharide/colanic/teichoic acid biosynthesis glycosyltransferase
MSPEAGGEAVVTVHIGSSSPATGLPQRPFGRGTSPGQRTRLHTRRGMPRAVDLVLAGSVLLVLAPLMALVAVLVRCTSRGSVLFAQTRLGQDGKPFRMLKFRTMYADCDDRLHREYVQKLLTTPAESLRSPGGLYKLVDDPRITRLGRWLRRSSLDELPQLINVLRGEMSLVGPRPALPWEAAMYDPRYARRFDVRPGITGLWQISGRNRLTATQALDLDVEYVERRSFWLDLAILCRTIPTVLSRDGAG